MNKTFRKIVGGALAVTALMGLAACGGKTEDNKADGKTYKVGIVQFVDDASLNQIEAAIEAELDAKAKELGINLQWVGPTTSDAGQQVTVIEGLIEKQVDGILIAPAGDDPAFLEATARQTPVVCIDRHFAKTSLPYVVTDNLRGGREATQHLIDRGHRRILCIQGVRHSIPSADRVRGYRQALEDNGLSAYARVTGDGFSIRNGYEQTLRALHVRQRPTAIFALSNTILLGALKAVREMKLRIPDDISLVSFDNYDYLDYLDPAVTRVGQPSDEIGAQAMEILLQRIAGETGGEEQRRLPPSLIVCRSVRKL